MPAFDGTGPRGMGPLSGRGLGSCKNERFCGQGRGRGRGAGPCFRQSFPQSECDKREELQAWRASLTEKLRWVEEELSKDKKEQ